MADSEPNNVDNSNISTVTPDTDDLDAFNDLFHGRVKEAPKSEAEEQTEETDETADTQEVETDEDEKPAETDEEHSDGDDDEDSDKSGEKPTKKPNRFQDRINELTAKAREAERREKELTRRLDEIAARQSPPVETPAAPKAAEDVGPTPDDQNEDGSDKYPLGEFDPQYIRDLTRHTIQNEQKASNERLEQERVQRETQQAREQLNTQWTEKLTKVAAEHDDYMEKTIELESTFDGLDSGYSDYLVNTIKSLDHGPEVLYHFANNLEEAQKFVKMGPLAATLALGELNARFKATVDQSQQEKPQARVTKAPVPPQVTNKGTKTRTSVSADTDDLDAFTDMFYAPKRNRR
jgi:DNA mismatch repair ATPase MutL